YDFRVVVSGDGPDKISDEVRIGLTPIDQTNRLTTVKTQVITVKIKLVLKQPMMVKPPVLKSIAARTMITLPPNRTPE
ncbi:MAG TPA: hypothetical protein PKH60_03515, partial [Candidatus Woesebacteria bacterium]|nr:hypothetical protein [Candidatus Woesebacteria bacterium]